MATSFVEYKNYGYWSNDAFLEGLLYLLIREFKPMELAHEWIAQLINEWSFAATAGFCGCIPVNLDKFFDSEGDRQLLAKALEQIIEKLQTVEGFVTADELNENEVSTGGWLGINKIGFINSAELMLSLVNGKLTTNAASPITYLKFE